MKFFTKYLSVKSGDSFFTLDSDELHWDYLLRHYWLLFRVFELTLLLKSFEHGCFLVQLENADSAVCQHDYNPIKKDGMLDFFYSLCTWRRIQSTPVLWPNPLNKARVVRSYRNSKSNLMISDSIVRLKARQDLYDLAISRQVGVQHKV